MSDTVRVKVEMSDAREVRQRDWQPGQLLVVVDREIVDEGPAQDVVFLTLAEARGFSGRS